MDEIPEGYYLDTKNSFYKKCFDTCKTGKEKGNIEKNNCVECKTNYIDSNEIQYNILYELNLNVYKNCYSKCPYNSYYDNTTNKYYCTLNDSCPENYYKLNDKEECIKKCGENNSYFYEFRKVCYKDCPLGSIKPENDPEINKYFCKPNCTKDNPYEIVSTQERVKNYTFIDLKEKNCVKNYKSNDNNEGSNNKEEEIKAQNAILDNFENGFTSENYDTSSLDNRVDEIYEDEKMKITLTTT